MVYIYDNPFQVIRTKVVNKVGQCKINSIKKYFYDERKLWEFAIELKAC